MAKRATKAEKVISAYKKVFSTPEGEEVLKDLINISGFRKSIIGKDPYETYFNEGSRVLLLRILQTIGMSEVALRKMIEHMSKEETDEYLT